MRADWVEERVVTEADRVVIVRDESVNQFAISANRKHPGRSPSSESTLQAADLVEGKRRAGPTSSVVARIYSQLEEQRAEHEHDNVVDEDRGVDARCPHGSYSTGWD